MDLPCSHSLDAQNFPVHVLKDLPRNHAVADKPNYCQDMEVCQIQAHSAEINVLHKAEPVQEVQFQRNFSAVIRHNLHKDQTNQEVLNQATNGKIASPECMNNYKDEIKCHVSCVGRPIIINFL